MSCSTYVLWIHSQTYPFWITVVWLPPQRPNFHSVHNQWKNKDFDCRKSKPTGYNHWYSPESQPWYHSESQNRKKVRDLLYKYLPRISRIWLLLISITRSFGYSLIFPKMFQGKLTSTFPVNISTSILDGICSKTDVSGNPPFVQFTTYFLSLSYSAKPHQHLPWNLAPQYPFSPYACIINTFCIIKHFTNIVSIMEIFLNRTCIAYKNNSITKIMSSEELKQLKWTKEYELEINSK